MTHSDSVLGVSSIIRGECLTLDSLTLVCSDSGTGESSGCLQHHPGPTAGADGGKIDIAVFKQELNLNHVTCPPLVLVQVIRSGQKVVEKKGAPGQKQGGGFFSGWFGRKAKKEEQEEMKETQGQ